MPRHMRMSVIVGAAVILVLFGGAFWGAGEGTALALDFAFTYTSDDTVETGYVGGVVGFEALLTNTGTEIDSYLVTLTRNAPTPTEWTWELCAGGTCEDNIYQAVSYLEPGWTDEQFLNVDLTVSGQGSYTLDVESYGNPDAKLSKSITFLIHAYPQGPVTDFWGMIALVTLIAASGLYLIHRRYRPARQT